SEYQRVKTQSLFQESPIPGDWQTAWLLGAGRRFNVTSKISVSIALLYDLNYRNNDLNQRPLNMRVGYQIR
ncbi:MAG: hypothetical protein AAFN10_28180, partial [Bacteroidota bacterium]